MEAEIELHEGVPICGPGESCEIINNFLNRDDKLQFKLEKSEDLFRGYKRKLEEIARLKEYLLAIRDEEDRVVVELYKLTTTLDG